MDTFDWNELQNAAGETPASEQTNSQPSEPVQAQSPVNEPQSLASIVNAPPVKPLLFSR